MFEPCCRRPQLLCAGRSKAKRGKAERGNERERIRKAKSWSWRREAHFSQRVLVQVLQGCARVNRWQMWQHIVTCKQTHDPFVHDPFRKTPFTWQPARPPLASFPSNISTA